MENNAISQLTFVGAISAFHKEMIQLIFDLRWAFMAIVILIILDFCYGIADSVGKRGEDFHLSRAGRRTIGKLIEYICYPVIAAILGMAITEPMGWCSYQVAGALGVLAAILFECDSITEHFCSVHNLQRRFSLKGWIIDKLAKKFGAK